ncbi:EamA family transporter [Desulfuromonas thiophila]|uniref:Permease of the drug/metabolite transporter (DMT) superfamily n=1 Tax=Desulfuromonas thiophila TaxID=57664 RepID=A0A1G7BGN5_9BACT|nr:EamA family transporter [Desulfuromonas thiophila]SDE26142.1 Permease of the drug/metabolite transporter (DMT) superfamily [Desulfuromonas thiophila]
MTLLLLVSLVWAFSFGLIKGQLTGLDPNLVAFIRLALALLVFLPFYRPALLPPRFQLQLLVIGAIQYGLMYSSYTAAFKLLHAYEVALFTIFTPLYVTLFHDLASRTLHRRFWLTAVLACAGAALVLYQGLGSTGSGSFLRGFALVQGANLCFAFGQIAYRRLLTGWSGHDHQLFALLYGGACLVTAPLVSQAGSWPQLTRLLPQQLLVLLYLGVLASGLCFFGWNRGARQVTAGVLAVSNNLKIPLAVLCSGLLFGEPLNGPRLLVGFALLLLALVLERRASR